MAPWFRKKSVCIDANSKTMQSVFHCCVIEGGITTVKLAINENMRVYNIYQKPKVLWMKRQILKIGPTIQEKKYVCVLTQIWKLSKIVFTDVTLEIAVFLNIHIPNDLHYSQTFLSVSFITICMCNRENKKKLCSLAKACKKSTDFNMIHFWNKNWKLAETFWMRITN